MPIFPLDSIRNAAIDRRLEPTLEELRVDVQAFPFDDDPADVLHVFDSARPRLNVLASHLTDMEGASGADIGTGFGFLPVLLGRLGLAVAATERDLAIAAFARHHGVTIRRYSIGRESAPFEPASLDFLVFAEVLEHLKLTPVPVLSDLAALLHPGGRFLLTTPNVARLAHLDALAAGENFLEPFPEEAGDADATDFLEHVREYSVREVVDAVEAAGLGVNQVLMTGWGAPGYDLLPNPWANEICVVIAQK